MQVLDNLFDLIAPPSQSTANAASDADGATDGNALETEQFFALLAQHLEALGTIKGDQIPAEDGTIYGQLAQGELAEMFAAPLPISAEIALPASGLAYRNLLQVDPNQEPDGLGERVNLLLNQIFQDALEQPIEPPEGFKDADLEWLKSIDPERLAQDLNALKQLATAVTMQNGTPLTEAEFLAILEGDLAPRLGSFEFDTDAPSEADEGTQSVDGLLTVNDEDADQSEEAPVIAVAQNTSATVARDAFDAETAARQRLAAEDNLDDRRSARDARLAAAAGDDGDGSGDSFAAMGSLAAQPNPSSSVNGPINLTAAAQLASLDGPGAKLGQGMGGQTGSGQGGDGFTGGLFGAANAEEAAKANASAQQSPNNINFQSMVANTTPSRSAMNPATMQVSLQISQAAKAGQNQIRIQLQPAQLGAIEVELSFDDDGKVSGKLIAEKAETLDMLRNDSRTLEKALQDAGLTIGDEGLEFSLKDGGEGDANPEFGGTGGDGPAGDGEDGEPVGDWQHVDIITEDTVDVRI
ncbi:MAG: flagellar hook-length control protein FliK [Pseudomonadota bacterium]